MQIINITLDGTWVILKSSDCNQSSATPVEKKTYDAAGAAYFIIAVVLVYGMSIILMIGAQVRRKSMKRDVDRAISNYLGYTRKDVGLELDKKKVIVNITKRSASFTALTSTAMYFPGMKLAPTLPPGKAPLSRRSTEPIMKVNDSGSKIISPIPEEPEDSTGLLSRFQLGPVCSTSGESIDGNVFRGVNSDGDGCDSDSNDYVFNP